MGVNIKTNLIVIHPLFGLLKTRVIDHYILITNTIQKIFSSVHLKEAEVEHLVTLIIVAKEYSFYTIVLNSLESLHQRIHQKPNIMTDIKNYGDNAYPLIQFFAESLKEHIPEVGSFIQYEQLLDNLGGKHLDFHRDIVIEICDILSEYIKLEPNRGPVLLYKYHLFDMFYRGFFYHNITSSLAKGKIASVLITVIENGDYLRNVLLAFREDGDVISIVTALKDLSKHYVK